MSKPAMTYNSLIEVAARCLVVLRGFPNDAVSFAELRLLDFFSVYSGDVDGPQSVHNVNDARGGAYSVREKLLPPALKLLVDLGLVIQEHDTYRAFMEVVPVDNVIQMPTSRGEPVLPYNHAQQGAYKSFYLQRIANAVLWMRRYSQMIGFDKMIERFFTTAYQLQLKAAGAVPPSRQYEALLREYEADKLRMHGLLEACDILEKAVSAAAEVSPEVQADLPDSKFFAATRAEAERELSKLDVSSSELKMLLRTVDKRLHG